MGWGRGKGQGEGEAYVVDLEDGKVGVPRLDGGLAVDEVEGEAVDGVVKGDGLAAAGGLEVVDVGGLGRSGQRLGGEDEVLLGRDGEGGAAELGLVRGLEGEDEGLGAVAAEVGRLADGLGLLEAKVVHEGLGVVDLFVLVEDVGDAHQLDLLGRVGRVAGRHGGRLRVVGAEGGLFVGSTTVRGRDGFRGNGNSKKEEAREKRTEGVWARGEKTISSVPRRPRCALSRQDGDFICAPGHYPSWPGAE